MSFFLSFNWGSAFGHFSVQKTFPNPFCTSLKRCHRWFFGRKFVLSSVCVNLSHLTQPSASQNYLLALSKTICGGVWAILLKSRSFCETFLIWFSATNEIFMFAFNPFDPRRPLPKIFFSIFVTVIVIFCHRKLSFKPWEPQTFYFLEKNFENPPQGVFFFPRQTLPRQIASRGNGVGVNLWKREKSG